MTFSHGQNCDNGLLGLFGLSYPTLFPPPFHLNSSLSLHLLSLLYTSLHFSVPLPLIQDADFLPDTYNPYLELQSPGTAVTVQTFNIHFWFVNPSHPECLWLPIGPFNEGKPVDGRALPTYQLEGLQ